MERVKKKRGERKDGSEENEFTTLEMRKVVVVHGQSWCCCGAHGHEQRGYTNDAKRL
jgi:hypothetical protein